VSGVAAVQARIAELQTQLRALSSTGIPAQQRTTATAGAASTDFAALLSAVAPQPTTTPAPGPTGRDLVEAGRQYLGAPYVWGGTDPARGVDCSGLVQRALRDLGVEVPRTVSQQRHVGTEVPSLAQARPGDLIVLGGDRHIGIYVGNGQMLHAPKTGDVVRIGPVYETPTSIRRVLPEATPAATTTAARPSALQQQTPYDLLFAAATRRYSLPTGLLAAVARTESGLDPSAVSPAGARGLMQLMPGTARELGVDPFDPAQAVDGAARLLSDHLATFGSVPLALAAYNAGPGAVRRYDGVPPYAETQHYVQKVAALMQGGTR
jgi:cell wall-associated NlpC family hydrolase